MVFEHKFASECHKCSQCQGALSNCKCTKNIKPAAGIVVAFKPELSVIQESFSIQFPSVKHAGRLFIRGILENKYVVAVICGIGISNATMTTQLLIDRFHPTNLILT